MSELRGKSVLVTGADGFIGSHLVQTLKAAGASVRAFVYYNSFNHWGWLDALPEGIDPCGENGEFHTFVSDGPGFRAPLQVEAGEQVERNGAVYADLVPIGR